MADARKNEKKNGALDLTRMMPVIIGLIAVAYAAAAWFLLFVPRIGSILPGGAYDTAALESRLQEDQTYLAKLNRATEAVRLVNASQRSRVAGIVPETPDIPGLLVQMDELASRNGLVLVGVDAVPVESVGNDAGIGKVSVTVNLDGGSYPQFLRYLYDVERSLRIIDPRTISFTPGSGAYGVTFTAYYLENRS